MSFNLTTGFELSCRSEVGGVRAVFFAKLADKDTYAEDDDIVKVLTLTSGKQFFKYEQVAGVANFQSKGVGNANSFYYETSGTFQLNGLTPLKIAEVNRLVRCPVMVIVLTENDNYLIAGTESGLWVNEPIIQTGTNKGDLSGIVISLTGQETRPIMPIDPTLIPSLTQPAP